MLKIEYTSATVIRFLNSVNNSAKYNKIIIEDWGKILEPFILLFVAVIVVLLFVVILWAFIVLFAVVVIIGE